MHMFMIGEGHDKQEIGSEERNKEYLKIKQEIKEKLGIEDGFLPGFAPYEVMDLDGVLYYRGMGESMFGLVPGQPAQKDGIITCLCGNKSFHINYASYECIGICTKCRKEHSLYSG